MAVQGPSGATVQRTYAIVVPVGYDDTKPYPVVFEGAGCGATTPTSACTAGYPFQQVDTGGAIVVGIDYGAAPGLACYDSQNPLSNDVAFFPLLKQTIESELCVDEKREFFSGYGGGASFENQMTCAFADKLRGAVQVSGTEPLRLPACTSGPLSAFFIHDKLDAAQPYAADLPACTRILMDNGCGVATCDPTDIVHTKPYVPIGTAPPAGTKCVQWSGCPAAFPVVFCTTTGQGHLDQQQWAIAAFWNFIAHQGDP
jgi:poly(3-hydroxybutyrate) depolymerase